MQKNWIGKSFGCEINFQVHNNKDKLNIFTTRPDTIFGASFIALSIDHPMSKISLKMKNFYNSEKNVANLVRLKRL